MPRSGLQRCAAAAVSVGVAALLLAGCSDDSGSTGSDEAGPATSLATSVDPSAGLVGFGCAAYMASNARGAASVDAMALDPVATAISNNPMLTSLSKAVSGQLNPRVNITDTLNSSQFTVFAPVDDAFAKLSDATRGILGTDDQLLTKLLFENVIQGQLKPDAIVGTHKTVAGGNVTVTGSGADLEVDGKSSVICGGMRTSNATIYLTDSVTVPSS